MKKGLLLINLGTPDAPDVSSVRRYLREFLADSRVITLPALLRYILLYGVILPFRPKKTARAYQAIWTQQGSPLLIHSEALKNKVQNILGEQWTVSLGMRYGKPSLNDALHTLKHCDKITILPLYPQYSSAATGSSLNQIMQLMAKDDIFPTLYMIRDFYQHSSFINAQASLIKPYLEDHDFLLFSYHGVPENHILKDECQTLCRTSCSPTSPRYSGCYRAQCIQTTKMLAKALGLSKDHYALSFQSRLGRTPWIKPYTDELLQNLAASGVKRLAVTCPSFVADCLETIEEIGIQAKEQWQENGGETLTLIPSLNAEASWAKAITDIMQHDIDN